MIVLRLDKSALMHLVDTQPEEVKLELTRAVLAEASRTLVRGIIPEQVETIVTAAVNAEVAEQIGSVTGSWSKKKVKLNPEVKEAIEGLVKDEAQQIVLDAYRLFKKTLDEKVAVYLAYARDVTKQEFERVAWIKIRQEMHDEVERQMALMRNK